MKKVIAGINDVFSIYPEMEQYWDYKANKLNPKKIHFGSGKVCHWTCKNNHKYTRRVNIAVNTECPICKKEELSIFNKPYIMKFWDYDKNKSINPKEHFEYESTKVYWKCKTCGFEWFAGISSRRKGLCPCCEVGSRIKVGYNDVTTIVPALLSDFIQSENPSIDLSLLGVADKKTKVNWTCHVCGFKWSSTVFSRTRGHDNKNKINKCPVCGKAKRSKTFSEEYPSLSAKWNTELNGFSFSEVRGTDYHKTFWWNCETHGPFKQVLSVMIRSPDTKTQGCPFCHNRTTNQFNSLKNRYPDVFNELSKEDNILISKEIDFSDSSSTVLCWICKDCNKKYYMTPKERIDFYKRKKCPCINCRGRKTNIEHYL